MFFGAVRNKGTENARVGWKMRYALHRNPIPARVGLDLEEGSYQLKTTGDDAAKRPELTLKSALKLVTETVTRKKEKKIKRREGGENKKNKNRETETVCDEEKETQSSLKKLLLLKPTGEPTKNFFLRTAENSLPDADAEEKREESVAVGTNKETETVCGEEKETKEETETVCGEEKETKEETETVCDEEHETPSSLKKLLLLIPMGEPTKK